MKDGLDIVTDVWGLLNVPAVNSKLGTGGSVWEDEKPAGRGAKYCDVVVNSLGITNTQQQNGIVNINIFVPNIARLQPDGTKQPMTDRVKLIAIRDVVYPLVENVYRPTFSLIVEDPGTILKDTDGSSFISIQLNYYSVQNNFKNI